MNNLVTLEKSMAVPAECTTRSAVDFFSCGGTGAFACIFAQKSPVGTFWISLSGTISRETSYFRGGQFTHISVILAECHAFTAT